MRSSRSLHAIALLLLGCRGGVGPGGMLLPAPAGGGVESLTVALPEAVISERIATAPMGRHVIAFVSTATRDSRDLLDSGVDALLTDDPAVLEYAAARVSGGRGLVALALPWSTTYALRAAAPLPTTDSVAFRESLARDAVGGEARGAARPAWWRDAARCPAKEGPVPPPPGAITDRVVYAERDRHARALAERLVGLAARLRAVGLGDAELNRALRAGAEFGYVLALPSRSSDPCRDLARVGLEPRHVPALEPLVETRWRLIVRPGRFGVSIDEDGIPHFR